MINLMDNKIIKTFMYLSNTVQKGNLRDIKELKEKLDNNTLKLERIYDSMYIDYKILENLIDLLPAIVFLKDKDNRIIKANKKFYEETGVDESILNKVLHEIDSNNEKFINSIKKYYTNDLEVIRTGKPKLNIIERLCFDKNGSECDLYKTDKIPFVVNNEIAGVACFSINITEIFNLLKNEGISI